MLSAGARVRETAAVRSLVREERFREVVRRRSFNGWPNTQVSSGALAKAGFFYTHIDDVVECAFCGGLHGNWSAGDCPRLIHRSRFPKCPLVGGLSCGNVPVENEPEVGLDEAEVQGIVSAGLSGGLGPNLVPLASFPSDLGLREVRSLASKHVAFSSFDSRLKTFTAGWPVNKIPKRADMANAGWYFAYEWYSDATICFHCGGRLQDWESTDDPWVEHARHFPNCSYLWLVKGPHFVAEIRRQVAAGEEPKAPEPEDAPTDESSLPEDLLCKICLTNKMSHVFLPCSHLCACAECAGRLVNCPICRKKFQGFVKVFV